MKKLCWFACIAILLAVQARAQNYTTVSATKIQNLGQGLLTSGTLCFTATDANNHAINFQPGGGGQVIYGPLCQAVAFGAVTPFQVPNPANTIPAGILYTITVSGPQIVGGPTRQLLLYQGVSFSGATFNFDNYAQTGAAVLPPFGGTINGPLQINGNLSITGTCTGCGSAGTGITSLNGLIATVQTFANEANIGVSSLGSTHTFTWSGVLALGRGGLNYSGNTGAAGKIPIGDGAGHFVEGDPLVQGLYADGSTSAANPVAIGGYDTAGTPALHRAIELNSAPAGTEYGLVTRNIPSGTQTISGNVNATLPAGQAVELLDSGGTNKASISAGGAVKVDGSAVTQPVSGTVTAVQPTGTNLHVVCDSGCSSSTAPSDNSGFTAGTTPVSPVAGVYNDAIAALTTGSLGAFRLTSDRMVYVNVGKPLPAGTNVIGHVITDSGSTTAVSGTVAVSAASLPLPTGAAQDSTVSGLEVAQGSTTSGQKGILMQGAVTTSAPTYTNAQTAPFSLDTAGNIRVNLTNASIAVTGTFFQSTQPVSLASGAAVDGAIATLGSKADAADAHTDTTAVSIVSVLKEISAKVQSPASTPVTGTFWQSTQPVSSTQLPSALDGSGYLKTHEQGTATVAGANSDDGANSTTKLGVHPHVAASAYPSSALTSGHEEPGRVGLDGLHWTAQLPSMYPASYAASATVTVAASASDIAVLPGNATNTVLVTKVRITCQQTTAGQELIQLIKRSTADTSGTSSNMTVVPDDSSNAAGSSVPKTYTANPTTGTPVGNVDTAYVGCMASGTATPGDIYILNRQQKPIVLRGTAQQLAVNLNGVTVTGGSFAVTFEYIETVSP